MDLPGMKDELRRPDDASDIGTFPSCVRHFLILYL